MRNLRRRPGPMARVIGILSGLIVYVVASGTVAAARDESLTVFLNLPMANGFSEATHVLIETKDLIRDELSAATELRLVDRAEDADVVLTVIARGRGHSELAAALRSLNRTIVAQSVPIADTERYIEILLTTGSCRTATALTVNDPAPDSCYRRVFVGVGLGEPGERRPANKPRRNTWEMCAEGVVRDIRAWLSENASRLRTLRLTPATAGSNAVLTR